VSYIVVSKTQTRKPAKTYVRNKRRNERTNKIPSACILRLFLGPTEALRIGILGELVLEILKRERAQFLQSDERSVRVSDLIALRSKLVVELSSKHHNAFDLFARSSALIRENGEESSS
jgi:hypothetical protein